MIFLFKENMRPKFRPDEPIYLSVKNLKVKTYDEVFYAVEKLRSLGWLCVAVREDKEVRPFHLSFSDVKELAEFKAEAAKAEVEFRTELILPVDEADFPEADKAEDAVEEEKPKKGKK